jgi:decaprenyl-phosphate phosphoribosyltransferase
VLKTFIKLLRVHHWLKNLFLFSAPFFGGVIFEESLITKALPAFLAFSLGASSVYIFNDIMDRERDRLHPLKKDRPIASGIVALKTALLLLMILLSLSIYLSLLTGKGFLLYLLLYIFLQILYSLKLKSLVIIDIFAISAGFVIRVLAGGVAFHVEVSPWLFATIFMISLVLASGKRLSEFKQLSTNASLHRESLGSYSDSFLREIFLISSGTALVTYALYTVEQSPDLMYTIPLVTFGLFRYLLLAEKGLGDATEALTKDLPLSLTVILWLLLVGVVRY